MLTLISLVLFLTTSGLLVFYFLKNDRGTKESKGALLAAVSFGILAILTALWLEFFLPNPSKPDITLPSLFFIALAIGIIEESAKFIPLALFIKNKSYFNEHTDGVIYFGIVGLTFGLVENLFYLFFYKDRLGGSEMTGIFRLIVLFFFHAASTGIIGYYLSKSKIQRQSIMKPIAALLLLSLIHGLYDFLFFYAAHTYQNPYAVSDNNSVLVVCALVLGLIISALLNTFLFLYYGRARQWDASIGLALDTNTNNSVSGASNTLPSQTTSPIPVHSNPEIPSKVAQK